MEDINRFLCTGRLTRDSQIAYTNSGTAVLNFSIAYTRSIKKDDNWSDKSCFIEAVIWGKRAEKLNQYLLKGQQITAEGQLDFETWESADHQKRSRHKLIVDNLRLTGSKKQDSQNVNDIKKEYLEDEIPF